MLQMSSQWDTSAHFAKQNVHTIVMISGMASRKKHTTTYNQTYAATVRSNVLGSFIDLNRLNEKQYDRIHAQSSRGNRSSFREHSHVSACLWYVICLSFTTFEKLTFPSQ